MFFLDGLPWLIVGLVVGGAVENGLPLLVAWAVRGVSPPPGWWGSSRWLGALGGASLMDYLYCRRRGLLVGRAFDLFAVPLPLAVARVGCLLNGCCYGRETSAWPALVPPGEGGVWARRYPTQLADILANLLIFALLYAGCMRILAVSTPPITDTDTMRETFMVTATSTVSPTVWADTFGLALAPAYRLREGFAMYLPLVLRLH